MCSSDLGFPPARVLAGGAGIYVVRLEVDYLREVRQGDELVVRTSIAEGTRTTLVFRQTATRSDATEGPSLDARVRAVWVGPDRKPTRVPSEVRAALGID